MNPVFRFFKWLYEFPAWVGQKLDKLYLDDPTEEFFFHWTDEDF